MKKIFKIAIGIVVLLMLTTTLIFAESFTYTNEIGGIKTTPVTVTTSEDNTSFSMNAIKPEGVAEDVTFILTVYNKTTKKLENVKMQTKSVGNTVADFAIENVAGITENHEINTSLVSLTDKIMPMGIPMTMPAKADAVNLRELKIDGVSVIEKFDDENKLTYEILKKFTNGSLVSYTWDDINSMLEPGTVDAGSTVSYVNENTFPDKQTLTVTATDGSEKDYIINYMYPIHTIKGAIQDADFEQKVVSRYAETYGSKDVVTATALGGDGYLYTNLQAFEIDDTTITEKSGSVPFANYISSTSSSYWLITAINDADAVGADYFGINTNISGIFGENATYDGTNAFNTLSDGTEWFKFTLEKPARVTIYATVDCIDAYSEDGWTGESSSGEPYIIVNRADKLSADTHKENYTCKVYKEFPAGEVVIKYHTVLNDNARAPFITVRH